MPERSSRVFRVVQRMLVMAMGGSVLGGILLALVVGHSPWREYAQLAGAIVFAIMGGWMEIHRPIVYEDASESPSERT